MGSADKRIELGATPGRLCAVGVLGITLIVVLYSELSKNGSAIAPATIVPPRQTVAHARRSIAANSTKQQDSTPLSAEATNRQGQNDLEDLKTAALDSALEHDPFAVPAALLHLASRPSGSTAPPPTGSASRVDNSRPLDKQAEDRKKRTAAAAQAREDALQALEKQGVSVVLRDGNQWIAVIGDKTVRVGDQLGTFRVIEILPHGVVIEDPPPNTE